MEKRVEKLLCPTCAQRITAWPWAAGYKERPGWAVWEPGQRCGLCGRARGRRDREEWKFIVEVYMRDVEEYFASLIQAGVALELGKPQPAGRP